MDKSTLSNYGWVVIAVLVLSVMIALATPFGEYIGNAVKSTTEGLFKVEQKALGAAGLIIGDQSFEDNGGGSTPAPAPVVYGATFTDGTFLTWEELKLAENGTKYEYDASVISDTEIGDYAFSDCTSLTSIDLPDNITTIGEGAFNHCTSLTNIDLPDNITTIGEGAFCYCTSLTSIDLPESLTSIGEGAFCYCTSLTSIDLPDSVTSIGNDAFVECTSLTSIDLPDSITTIGEGAFFSCTSLTSIDLPESLTSIGESALYYCTSLTSIDLPESLTSIGYGAFDSCTSLTNINYAGSMDDWNNITLGEYWKYNVPATVVHCSDGDVSIEYIAPVAM